MYSNISFIELALSILVDIRSHRGDRYILIPSILLLKNNTLRMHKVLFITFKYNKRVMLIWYE